MSEKAIVEAVLFSMGDSVKVSKISAALGCDDKHTREVINELIEEYESEDRGLKIIEVDGSYQMCTKNETYEALIKVVKIPKDYKLTDIQLETLSIIAYKQPITKMEIEKIRGVQSDHAVNRLIDAGLVEEKGRLTAPGRPLIFGTTEEFLRRFGLRSKDDLPNIQTEKVEEMKMEAEEEIGYIKEQEDAKKRAEEAEVLSETGIVTDSVQEDVQAEDHASSEVRIEIRRNSFFGRMKKARENRRSGRTGRTGRNSD